MSTLLHAAAARLDIQPRSCSTFVLERPRRTYRLEPRADRAGGAPHGAAGRFGVLDALADFGLRLAGVIVERLDALKGAGRSPIKLASPYARLARLLSRILAFAQRLEKEAAQPKFQRPAAALAAKAEAPERRAEGERREPRENLLKGLRLHEWAGLPFDELVDHICKEFESIARTLGDHPLVQEAKTLAAKVLRPPPPDPPPLPAPNRSGLPPDGMRAALLRAASPRAPPDVSAGDLRGRLLGSVLVLPKP